MAVVLPHSLSSLSGLREAAAKAGDRGASDDWGGGVEKSNMIVLGGLVFLLGAAGEDFLGPPDPEVLIVPFLNLSHWGSTL